MSILNRVCDPPPEAYTPPEFTVPAMACDSHFHVTPSTPWVLASDASYTPALASQEMAQIMRSDLRLERGVVVQASAFGTDNRGVLEALAHQPRQLRGSVVLDAAVTDLELERIHHLGVRGVRFITNGLGGTVGVQAMRALAPRVAPLGWHIEVLPAVNQWEELLPIFMKLPATLVIDHMGGIPAAFTLDHPSCKAMRHLVRERGAHVKLIGCRVSDDLMDSQLIHRAHTLYADAPHQMVWGTDWPHVGVVRMPDAGKHLNTFARWFENDTAALKNILAMNPGRLFDFPPPQENQ